MTFKTLFCYTHFIFSKGDKVIYTFFIWNFILSVKKGKG